MTAETLKPFITPNSAEHFPTSPRLQRSKSKLIEIGLCVTCIVLATAMVGVGVWHTMRVTELETEFKSLTRVVESMQKQLGLNYLDDLNDFEKEYTNALIDDPNSIVDDEDDDEDDEDEDEDDVDDDEDTELISDEYDEIENYDELVRKYNNYDPNEDEEDDIDDDVEHNASDDDNLYDDFEKFKDSKKKPSSRRARSIAKAPNGLAIFEGSFLERLNKTDDRSAPETARDGHALAQQRERKPTMRPENQSFDAPRHGKGSHKRHIVSEHGNERRGSALRHRGQRRRKIPMVKSAKSSNSMSSGSFTPAAHFHLNRKVPDRHSAIRVDSYPGDMYIGSPSWSHEITTEHYFKVDNGVLTVREPGLYYIYAQVCYNNTHDQNGFVIFHGHKPYLQCLNTVPTNMPLKIHTCHTSGLIFLQANETIHLRDFHSDRNVILKDINNRSYFGLMKI